MSATDAASSSNKSTVRGKKVLVPKVWKRPHSTIYGKNVEFGSSLYSDKIGELNGRKFNSELPWSVRNSGGSTSSSAGGQYSQGYLSNLLVDQRDIGGCSSYADLLAVTNPRRAAPLEAAPRAAKRVDFYEQYMDFSKEIDRLSGSSLLMQEPLLTRKVFSHLLDFDYELGLFVPSSRAGAGSLLHASERSGQHAAVMSRRYEASGSAGPVSSSSSSSSSLFATKSAGINDKIRHQPNHSTTTANFQNDDKIQPIKLLTRNTNLLPKHKCHLTDSPYGQSADGRKLSLSSINPHSYRPSLPSKTTTTHASDGEEVDLVDKSSPFYTDRWAGKTIRHFDSDLYSNANLFKSMIL